MKEIWIDVKGYENIYKISNSGNIKSLNYNHTNKEKILKYEITNKGYLRVTLCKDKVKSRISVHRLVAFNFIPNLNNLPQVNHINGIKTDNRVCNLEWCTGSENNQHAYDRGLKKKPIGKLNSMAKSITQYGTQLNFIRRWDTIAEASKGLGIKPMNIIDVCKKRKQQVNNFIFIYDKEVII